MSESEEYNDWKMVTTSTIEGFEAITTRKFLSDHNYAKNVEINNFEKLTMVKWEQDLSG